jgi:hypothetical protein
MITAKRGLTVCLCCLGAALLAAWSAQPIYAQDVDSNGHATTSPNPSAAPGASGPASVDGNAGGGSKLDDRPPSGGPDNPGAPHGSAKPELRGNTAGGKGDGVRVPKDAHAIEKRAKDVDPIDTRISVQPRLHSGRALQRQERRTAIPALVRRNFTPRRQSNPAASGGVARNAIGAPVARHDGERAHDGDHYDGRPAATGAGAPPAGLDRNPSNGLVRAVPTVGPANFGRPNTNQPVSPAVVNRAVINGTGLVHPGSALSGIGGPAKTVTGLNGTTLHPKR